MSVAVRWAIAAVAVSATPLAAQPGRAQADWNGVWFTEQGAATQISGFLSSDDARRANQLPLIDLTAPWTVRQAYVRAEGLDRRVMDTFSNDRTTEEEDMFAILPPEHER